MTSEIEKNRVMLEDLIPTTLTQVDIELLEKFKKENPAEYKKLRKEADELVS